jgi:hypothetical protein
MERGRDSADGGSDQVEPWSDHLQRLRDNGTASHHHGQRSSDDCHAPCSNVPGPCDNLPGLRDQSNGRRNQFQRRGAARIKKRRRGRRVVARFLTVATPASFFQKTFSSRIDSTARWNSSGPSKVTDLHQ